MERTRQAASSSSPTTVSRSSTTRRVSTRSTWTSLARLRVAVPGGPITGGNLQVSLDRAQSLADLQQIALRRLRGASTIPIELHMDHGFPRGVIANVSVTGTEPVARAANFIKAFKDFYRINSTDLALRSTSVFSLAEGLVPESWSPSTRPTKAFLCTVATSSCG